jgi:phenylacetate-CoA ligase
MLCAKDGRKISPSFGPHLFLRIPGVRQFQIVQNSMDNVILKIIPDSKFTQNTAETAKSALLRYLGDINIDVQICENIETSRSGKLRFVINNMPVQKVPPKR